MKEKKFDKRIFKKTPEELEQYMILKNVVHVQKIVKEKVLIKENQNILLMNEVSSSSGKEIGFSSQ